MSSLYAAVKTRRFALATTSESGGKTGTARQPNLQEKEQHQENS
jgi:hypothetical protein